MPYHTKQWEQREQTSNALILYAYIAFPMGNKHGTCSPFLRSVPTGERLMHHLYTCARARTRARSHGRTPPRARVNHVLDFLRLDLNYDGTKVEDTCISKSGGGETRHRHTET